MEVDYNYLDLLNPQQREAVVYKDGPSLVIAGAGSGKTRVLTYKIVDLIRSGYEPYRIMALTFTNKAAREMKERILPLVGERIASRLWMGTFHSIFIRILRRHPEETGYKSSFTIYDTPDTRSLIKSIVKDLGLDEKVYKPATVAAIISNAKNAMVSPEQYMRDPDYQEADRRSRRPMIGRIYAAYCERCRLADAMDFDDVLFNMNLLLRDYPEVRRHYQDFFRYILVDEYQDTNFAQHLIVSQLIGDSGHLCVVGDDAQSIYSFRGANISNILEMEKRYPGLRIFKLERNYRSTQNIINAAGSLIDKNTRQMKKTVFSENEEGEKVRIFRTYSDVEEAAMIANLVSQTQLSHHDPYDEFAVLYRTNAQSRVLEEALRKRAIPYRVYGSKSFYERKEVKDAVAYFRLSVNPDDDEALRRIINFPARGIGETTLKKLYGAATAGKASMWSVLQDPAAHSLDVNKGTMNKLDGFRQLIQEFIDDREKGSNAYELGQLIINRTGMLLTFSNSNTPEDVSRRENVNELLAGLKSFVEDRIESGEEDLGMSAFLSEISLATDQDKDDDDNTPRVTLMTAHAAKGLEFKHVFITGVEEDLFPSSMSQDSLDQVEEERRLLYVAMTRAKTTCTMTYAGSRFRNGQTVISRPSRFLKDISPKFIDVRSSSAIGFDDDSGYLNPLKNYGSWGGSSKSAGRPSSDLGDRLGTGYRGETPGTPFGGGGGRRDYVADESEGVSGRRLRKISSGVSSNVKAQHTPAEVPPGTKISHAKFGVGVVEAVMTVSGEPMIKVNFVNAGVKRLLLKFAKFDIL